ncbi:hypothetical protein J6590_056543 [Homalodisca vitripennis]|nr:hypothetical protein J6590_056543 [Homalodisca vitripennis]
MSLCWVVTPRCHFNSTHKSIEREREIRDLVDQKSDNALEVLTRSFPQVASLSSMLQELDPSLREAIIKDILRIKADSLEEAIPMIHRLVMGLTLGLRSSRSSHYQSRREHDERFMVALQDACQRLVKGADLVDVAVRHIKTNSDGGCE